MRFTQQTLCDVPEAVEFCLDDCYREIGRRIVEHLRKTKSEAKVRLTSSVEFDRAYCMQRIEVSAFVT